MAGDLAASFGSDKRGLWRNAGFSALCLLGANERVTGGLRVRTNEGVGFAGKARLNRQRSAQIARVKDLQQTPGSGVCFQFVRLAVQVWTRWMSFGAADQDCASLQSCFMAEDPARISSLGHNRVHAKRA